MCAVSAPDSSALCQACGLCCDGTLHSHVLLRETERALAATLGVTVEIAHGHAAFRQPCPFYQAQRCAIYTATRPRICSDYRCALLKGLLAGTLTLEQALHTVQRVREMIAALIAQCPPGYSLPRLRCELDEGWDSGTGLVGSPEARQQNAELLLDLVTLIRYLHQHLGKPKQ